MNRTLVLQIGALSAATGVFGVSFGAMAAAAGLSPLAVSGMSVLVFGGSAQLAALSVLVAGGGWAAAVASGLLLNARYLGFGVALAQRMPQTPGQHLLVAHLLTDESALLALAQPDPASARRVFRLAGGAIFVAWNAGTLVGVGLGAALGDPHSLGMDAGAAALMLALLAPLLTTARPRRAALAGGLLALGLGALLPPGVPILLAGLGALAADALSPAEVA